MKIDVTEKVSFRSSDIDGELLALIKCICGNIFDYWGFVISIYEDLPYACPYCGAKLYFENGIKIYQVIDE